jgi:hypothetical protein
VRKNCFKEQNRAAIELVKKGSPDLIKKLTNAEHPDMIENITQE